MKIVMIYSCWLSLFWLFLMTGALAQPHESTLFDLDEDLAQQLLPFDRLNEIAVRNSPLLKVEEAVMETKLSNTQLTKWSFLRGVGFSSNYQGGNQSVITNNDLSAPSLRLSSGYRLGVSANISVLDIFARRANIKEAQAEYRSARAKRDLVAQQLRRELYHLYQATLLSHRVLLMHVQSEQAALVAFQMAEIGWKEGRTTPADYASATRQYTDAQAQVEADRTAVATNLFDLATLAGLTLQQLHMVSRSR